MGRIHELERAATLLETPSTTEFIVVTDDRKDSGKTKIELAETTLRKSGIWEALHAFAEGLSPAKNAAVDFGYLDEGKFEPVAALRFVPLPGQSPDEPVTSKILRLVPGIDELEIRYLIEAAWGGDPKPKWKGIKFTSIELNDGSFREKMTLAMGNATGRMVDAREYIDGKFVGKPGIGN